MNLNSVHFNVGKNYLISLQGFNREEENKARVCVQHCLNAFMSQENGDHHTFAPHEMSWWVIFASCCRPTLFVSCSLRNETTLGFGSDPGKPHLVWAYVCENAFFSFLSILWFIIVRLFYLNMGSVRSVLSAPPPLLLLSSSFLKAVPVCLCVCLCFWLHLWIMSCLMAAERRQLSTSCFQRQKNYETVFVFSSVRPHFNDLTKYFGLSCCHQGGVWCRFHFLNMQSSETLLSQQS